MFHKLADNGKKKFLNDKKIDFIPKIVSIFLKIKHWKEIRKLPQSLIIENLMIGLM